MTSRKIIIEILVDVEPAHPATAEQPAEGGVYFDGVAAIRNDFSDDEIEQLLSIAPDDFGAGFLSDLRLALVNQ